MIASASRVVVDLGTGDGRAVVARARQDPDALVVGLDASADGMAEASRRAARPIHRGGLANALFAVAAAEQPPLELCRRANELTILFPWGSLLRGALAVPDAAAASAGIAALVAPGGTVRMLVSVDARDALGLAPLGADDRDRLAEAWHAHGLALRLLEPATDAEIRASGSSWARRLRAGRDRTVWRLELQDGRLAAVPPHVRTVGGILSAR